jgi:hypothetical protein
MVGRGAVVNARQHGFTYRRHPSSLAGDERNCAHAGMMTPRIQRKKSRARESPACSIGHVRPTQSPSKRDYQVSASMEEGDNAQREISVTRLWSARVPCSKHLGRMSVMRRPRSVLFDAFFLHANRHPVRWKTLLRKPPITTASVAPCSPRNRGTPARAPPTSILRDRRSRCRAGSSPIR